MPHIVTAGASVSASLYCAYYLAENEFKAFLKELENMSAGNRYVATASGGARVKLLGLQLLGGMA